MTSNSVDRSGKKFSGSSLLIICGVYLLLLLFDFPGSGIRLLDVRDCALLALTSIASLALAQFLWIRGATGLGILLVSLHMNALPFYVMLIVVLMLDASWSWWPAPCWSPLASCWRNRWRAAPD